MSLFPNKFLLNLLVSGLILSCPLNFVSAANNNNGNGKGGVSTLKPQTQTKMQWKNYSFPSAGFTVDMPTKPEHVQQSIDIPKTDLKISYETFLSEPSDNIVYVVSVWKYPGQVDMSKPEVNLQDGFSGMISALPGSEVLNMRMTEVDGFKALEFLVKHEDIYFQGKLILVYNTLYQVFTVYKDSEDMTNNYIHFIDSFKLVNPAQNQVAPPSKQKNGNGRNNGSKSTPQKLNL